MNRRGTRRGGASSSPEETFQKAVKLFQNGRLKKAEALLGKLLKSVGDNPDILHMLALVALKTNRPDAAQSHLERAVCLAPETARLHALLGLARKQAGQVDAAEVAYRQAIALNPSDADAHYNLAILYADQGCNEDAIEHYRTAARL